MAYSSFSYLNSLHHMKNCLEIKIIGIAVLVAAISAGTVYYFSQSLHNGNIVSQENTSQKSVDDKKTKFRIQVEGKGEKIFVTNLSSLFNTYVYSGDIDLNRNSPDGGIVYTQGYFDYKPENTEIYEKLGYDDLQKTIVIAPIFTKTAYQPNGFYNFYREECDKSCITSVPIKYDIPIEYTSSANGIKILAMLGYPIFSDVNIALNPEVLKTYDKVILMHNEYVTKEMFEAITNHPKVLYLYPNALYAEIEYDEQLHSITLIKGHFYPEKEIGNGFDWEFENSSLEWDTACLDWELYEIDNGAMLNCYPEERIVYDIDLLMAIKEF